MPLFCVCLQAQQHEWVRDHYPELFEEMKTQVAAGRFIPVGAVWVEMVSITGHQQYWDI